MISNKIFFIISIFFCIGLYNHSLFAQYGTRLTNPNIQVNNNEKNEKATKNAIPYIHTEKTIYINHSTWEVMTTQEFEQLSTTDRKKALENPERYIVTEEHKEKVIEKLQKGQKVNNLILQIKK